MRNYRQLRGNRILSALQFQMWSTLEKTGGSSKPGSLEIMEAVARCHKCRWYFFPQKPATGLDIGDITPRILSAAVYLAAEIRSFERAEKTIEAVIAVKVSRSTNRRLAREVGLELAKLQESDAFPDALEGKDTVVLDIAAVSCDGARVRTREPGNGRGVELSGENGWKEDKIASSQRMASNKSHVDGEDPSVP
ncbi:MAG: hypothetical protein ACI9HK_005555 [Pirellulaceae bacterium]|jgi:hypothetical protein